MTNKPENWEHEFRKIGDGSVRFIALRAEVLNFIRTEKEKSYKEGLEEGSRGDYGRKMYQKGFSEGAESSKLIGKAMLKELKSKK